MRDVEIVALFFARDEQAIKETEIKYGAYCRTLARNILKTPEDAEEIVNDILLAAWDSIPPKNPKNLKTFLGRLVRDKAHSRYRALNAIKRGSGSWDLISELDDCIPSPTRVEETVIANELADFIGDWLDRLSEKDAALFTRRYWYGESVSDLAEKLDISPMRVSQRLYVLRKKLKVFLNKKGVVI